ncbi:MAG: hypothetical protein ACQEQY_09090 [Halobacteriota archaeon]
MVDDDTTDGDDEEKSFRERVEEIREQREAERDAGEDGEEDPRERMQEMMGGGGGPGGMGGGMGGNPFAQMMSGMMGGGGGPGAMGGGMGPGAEGSDEGGVDTRRLERQIEELRREVGDVTTQLERIADALEADD